MVSTLGIIVFSLIILIAVIVRASTTKHDGFVGRFLNKLSVINGFLAAVGIYITYSIFKAQADKMANEITLSLIDRSWLKINEAIKNSKDTCPTLVNSLYFPWQRSVLGKIQSSEKVDSWSDCNYLSILMFQAWEDYLTLSEFDETGDQVWLANFLQWANSDVLRQNWNVLKTNFAPLTIEFGDYLFFTTKNFKPASQDEHRLLVQNLSKDPGFVKIKDKRKGIGSNSFSIV
jgi:hypothetical protein